MQAGSVAMSIMSTPDYICSISILIEMMKNNHSAAFSSRFSSWPGFGLLLMR